MSDASRYRDAVAQYMKARGSCYDSHARFPHIAHPRAVGMAMALSDGVPTKAIAPAFGQSHANSAYRAQECVDRMMGHPETRKAAAAMWAEIRGYVG